MDRNLARNPKNWASFAAYLVVAVPATLLIHDRWIQAAVLIAALIGIYAVRELLGKR